jgi:uncharacterized repeat protein (TIGR01451 family)
VTIESSKIVSNSALSNWMGGGGIQNESGYGGQALAFITESTISGNQAIAEGGGILNLSDQASAVSAVTISQSTISENTASEGGGIYNICIDSCTSSMTIEQSTISANSAIDGDGGGINNQVGYGTANVTVTHTTMWGNSASGIGNSIYSDKASFVFLNSIISDNGDPGDDCSFSGGATITDNGYNLVQDGTCISSGTSFSADPKLGPLQDNGGPVPGGNGPASVTAIEHTFTHALLPGSPAIDAIPAYVCTASEDQRTRARPFGFGCDIGAFEVTNLSLEIDKSVDDPNVEVGQTISFTIVLSNTGPGLNNIIISDTLTDGLNYIGPILVETPITVTVGTEPPILATVSISSSQRITVTLPVSVSYGLSANSELVNTARAEGILGRVFASHSLTVTVENSPPKAVDDGGAGYTTDEDSSFTTNNVLTNDSDPNGDLLSVSGINTNGTKGLVTNHGNGTFDYDPNDQFDNLAAGQQAADTFRYTVSDGHGGADTATVTIIINGINDPPNAIDDSGIGFTTDEDTPFTTDSVLTNDLDPNSDPLSVTNFDTTGTKGSVTDNGDGTFNYNPNGKFEDLAEGESTTDSFTYTISDGNEGTDTATVTITITGKDEIQEDYFIYLPLILRQP